MSTACSSAARRELSRTQNVYSLPNGDGDQATFVTYAQTRTHGIRRRCTTRYRHSRRAPSIAAMTIGAIITDVYW